MPKLIDLSGKKFGRLSVVSKCDKKSIHVYWNVVCECGNSKSVMGQSLRNGMTTSCGCLHREAITKHGMTGTHEFTVWQMMIQRCYNPNATSYDVYGGAGITMSDSWKESFINFISDMGIAPTTKHTVDRIDNRFGYSKENCKWATPLEQGANKRNNHIISLNGESMTLGQWCRKLGIPKSTVMNRLSRGKSVEEALRGGKHIA